MTFAFFAPPRRPSVEADLLLCDDDDDDLSVIGPAAPDPFYGDESTIGEELATRFPAATATATTQSQVAGGLGRKNPESEVYCHSERPRPSAVVSPGALMGLTMDNNDLFRSNKSNNDVAFTPLPLARSVQRHNQYLKTHRNSAFRKRFYDVLLPSVLSGLPTPREQVRNAVASISRPTKKARVENPGIGKAGRALRGNAAVAYQSGSRASAATSNATNTAGVASSSSLAKEEQYAHPPKAASLRGNKGLSPETLAKFMRTASPAALSKRGGRQLETPLHILLRTRPDDLATVDWMLLHNPKCVFVRDRHLNTPLHVACSRGRCASLDVVRHLHILHPEAASMRNFHGLTPLQLLQRCCTGNSDETSEKVVDFLRSKLLQEFQSESK